MRNRADLCTTIVAGLILLGVSGCALQRGVTVYPLLLTQTDDRPLNNLLNAVDSGDYPRALELSWSVERKSNPRVEELIALGRTQLAAGRLASAEKTLTRALPLASTRPQSAEIRWLLSQTSYLQDNFTRAARWASEANEFGMGVREWHLRFLDALAEAPPAYRFSDSAPATVPMRYGAPAIPRIEVSTNGTPVEAVIDTGAVLTIVSESHARAIAVRSLGAIDGTFLGLMREPITVSFGMIDRLEIGDLLVENVPVAIMPDEKMKFLTVGRQKIRMDMILGATLLRKFRIELFYSRREVTLDPLAGETLVPPPDQNLFFEEFRPVVPVSINRRGWHLFLLDTGSEVTFLNRATLLATSVRGSSRIHGATLQGLGGSRSRGEKIGNVELAIAGWGAAFAELPLYEHESGAFGIIGENLLENFHVIIDFGRMQIAFIEE